MLSQLPTVVGLTICRNVIREGTSGEYSVERVFTGVRCTGFPARTGHPVCALAVLTDGEGETPFDLLITRFGDTIEPVHQVRGVLRFRDRLQTVELIVRFPRFVFPAPGGYLFTLFVRGEWAAQQSLRVYPGGGAP